MSTTEPTNPSSTLTRWLRDYNESPWRRYIDALKGRGLLATVDGIMVDAGALFETRFRCDTRTCAGIDRDHSTESCCTDYQVEITPEERNRIVANGDEIIALLHRYDGDRVTAGRKVTEFFGESNQTLLVKEKGRCGFSYRDGQGQLRCGIHSLALEKGVPVASIKPLTCVLFPLVVYRFETGETFLTAISRDTASLLEAENDLLLPCLKMQQGDPMFAECRMAIEAGFGEAFYNRLTLAAGEFAANKSARNGGPD
ncbi:MAG TPA: DUF3109 family protein [Candidatus Binataceae bacterium]|nr:DUF3109 family protein [Candidatus Binataceae bacterium]